MLRTLAVANVCPSPRRNDGEARGRRQFEREPDVIQLDLDADRPFYANKLMLAFEGRVSASQVRTWLAVYNADAAIKLQFYEELINHLFVISVGTLVSNSSKVALLACNSLKAGDLFATTNDYHAAFDPQNPLSFSYLITVTIQKGSPTLFNAVDHILRDVGLVVDKQQAPDEWIRDRHMWWKAPDRSMGMNPARAFSASSDHQSRSNNSECNRSKHARSGGVSLVRHTNSGSREGRGNPKKAARRVGKERMSNETLPSAAAATATSVDTSVPSENRKRGSDLGKDTTPIIDSSNSPPLPSDHPLGRKRTKVSHEDATDVGVNLTPDVPSTVPIATPGMHSAVPASQDGPSEAPLL
ncbi:unnamed protein product [Calypogeia fissa]